MRLQDDGFVIRIIPFEETKRIITVFTKDHGVFQGMSDTPFEALTYVHGRWSSRTQGLGYWHLEEMGRNQNLSCHPRVGGDPLTYTHQLTYQLLCDLLYNVLPPRHPYPAIFEGVYDYLHPVIPAQAGSQKKCESQDSLGSPPIEPGAGSFQGNDTAERFIHLLFLILDEIGYGPSIPPPQEPIPALKLAFNLFLKHCQWHSPYGQLLLSSLPM